MAAMKKVLSPISETKVKAKASKALVDLFGRCFFNVLVVGYWSVSLDVFFFFNTYLNNFGWLFDVLGGFEWLFCGVFDGFERTFR